MALQYFDFRCSWPGLFQKSVLPIKFDIYVYVSAMHINWLIWVYLIYDGTFNNISVISWQNIQTISAYLRQVFSKLQAIQMFIFTSGLQLTCIVVYWPALLIRQSLPLLRAKNRFTLSCTASSQRRRIGYFRNAPWTLNYIYKCLYYYHWVDTYDGGLL